MARIFDFLDLDPARADQSAQSQRVRGKIAAGSSSLEQVSQYYRPGWRKAIPKPLRKAAWHALETLNARKAKREGQREMPDTIRRRLRAEFSETVTAVETLTGTKTPWPSGDMP